jgi:hypothetical protein
VAAKSAATKPSRKSPVTNVTATENAMSNARERGRVYKELLAFITAGKGWVVSEPGVTPLRFEAVDSSLADQLRDAGHRVSHIGIGERLTGFAGFQKTRDRILRYSGPVKTLVFEIPLPGDYAPIDHRGRYTQAALVSSCNSVNNCSQVVTSSH